MVGPTAPFSALMGTKAIFERRSRSALLKSGSHEFLGVI